MPMRFLRTIVPALALCLLAALSTGCAHNPRNPDPFEKANRFIYNVNDSLDKAILKPASDLYVKALPRPIRGGISNFLDNLGYTNVVINDLLQLRFGPALGGVGRIAVNTTVGLAGTMDPATAWGLPAHGNDLGITLGKYGAGPGPYLMLPLLGPSTFRDVPNIPVKTFVNPLHYMDVPTALSLSLDVAGIADGRSRAQSAIDFRDQAAIDPYIFVRDAYLQRRRSQIYGDKPTTPPDFYDDLYDDPASAPPPSTRPATLPASPLD